MPAYVIFITENDVIGKGEPLYTIERRITNIDEPFNDGEHILYVNGEDKNSTMALGKMMHDFFCTDPDDMHYRELAEKVRFFREDEEGVASMCKVIEDMREESARKASWQTKVESVLRWISMGFSFELIAKGEDLTLEQVQEIAGVKHA